MRLDSSLNIALNEQGCLGYPGPKTGYRRVLGLNLNWPYFKSLRLFFASPRRVKSPKSRGYPRKTQYPDLAVPYNRDYCSLNLNWPYFVLMKSLLVKMHVETPRYNKR